MTDSPEYFLGTDEFIDTIDPAVADLGRALRAEHPGDAEFAQAAFEWVRDRIANPYDADDPRVTLSASEVLREGIGLCYAKSNVLAAVLRSQGIPAALCYQLLGDAEQEHYVHGLVAVHLDGAWHRQDPRGNRPGLDAQFSVGGEHLAYSVDELLGQRDYPWLFRSVAPEVVDALRDATDARTCTLPSNIARPDAPHASGERWDLTDADGAPTGETILREFAEWPSGLFHVIAATCVFRADGRVLLTQRALAKSYPLSWEFPAGSVLAGESSLEGAQRELREETGIAVDTDDLMFVGRFREPTALLDFYVAVAPASAEVEIDPAEVAAWEWAPADEVAERTASGAMAAPWVARLAELWAPARQMMNLAGRS